MVSLVEPSMLNLLNDRLNKERSGSSSNLSLSSSGSSTAAPTFPITLHTLLTDSEALGFDDVVCWLPGGQAFKVLDPHRFAQEIMPRYFNQTKYKSFQRQCNIYGFQRVHHGPHKGGYTHKFFLQGVPDLCSEIKRETAPLSPKAPPMPSHRRGVSFDFRAIAPVPFAPQQAQKRHRRVVSWDARVKAQKAAQDSRDASTLKAEPFDWGMIAGAALDDLNPSSPLRDEEALLAELAESIQARPFSASSDSYVHPLREVSPPIPTLPSLQDIKSQPFPSLTESTPNPLGGKLEDSFQKSSMEQDELAFFKDLFNPTEFEVEKELLDSFDVVHGDQPNLDPATNAFMPYDAAVVEDELMEFAANISVGDAPPPIAPLPPIPEPEPLPMSMSMPVSYQPQPISSFVSPLASGAVNEHNFPRKLYRLLEDCESNPNYRAIVSWSNDGNSFSVHCKKQYVEYILPNYFDQTQYASFRRQLNMYNFVRQGNTSTYSNPYFVKNRPDLLDLIQRKSVNTSKGN